MKITPIDIAHKSFGKKLLGLNETEVLDYLQLLSSELENLIHERNSLKEVLREKELMLHEYRDRDQVLKNTIATASTMVEKLRKDAEKEAQNIVEEAKIKSDIIVRDARESLKKTYAEISQLARVRMEFEANIRGIAQAHLSILDQSAELIKNPTLPHLEIQKTAESTQ